MRLGRRPPLRNGGAASSETGDARRTGAALASKTSRTRAERAHVPRSEGQHMSVDRHTRGVLPIPHRPAAGLTTYDAKDPDTAFPPIEPLLPPEGAPNVLVVLLDDVGFGASSRLRRALPDPDRRAAGGRGAALQPVPHDRPVRADTAGAADRAEPPLGRDGQHHRDRHLRAGQQLAATEHQGAAGDHAEAQRVLDRTVRQVPRGAGLAVLADGPVRRLALRRRRVRDVLRLHRR